MPLQQTCWPQKQPGLRKSKTPWHMHLQRRLVSFCSATRVGECWTARRVAQGLLGLCKAYCWSGCSGHSNIFQPPPTKKTAEGKWDAASSPMSLFKLFITKSKVQRLEWHNGKIDIHTPLCQVMQYPRRFPSTVVCSWQHWHLLALRHLSFPLVSFNIKAPEGWRIPSLSFCIHLASRDSTCYLSLSLYTALALAVLWISIIKRCRSSTLIWGCQIPALSILLVANPHWHLNSWLPSSESSNPSCPAFIFKMITFTLGAWIEMPDPMKQPVAQNRSPNNASGRVHNFKDFLRSQKILLYASGK